MASLPKNDSIPDDWEAINREEDDDDEEEESEDEEEEEESFIVSAWRQHCVAIFVAVIATAVAYSMQQQSAVGSPAVTMSSPTTLLLRDHTMEINKHAHLHQYHRTANISFCGTRTSSSGDDYGLQFMDFQLPKLLIPTLSLHFAVDEMDDDNYSTVLSETATTVSSLLLDENVEEYRCLKRQEENSPVSYVKGMTAYYKEPSIEMMYSDAKKEETLPSSVMKKNTHLQPAVLTFTGFAAKFVNLSPKPVLLHWDGRGGHGNSRRLIGEIAPFEALGTATTPGQSFSVSPVYDSSDALARWVVTADEALLYYDPMGGDDSKLKQLTDEEQQLYQMQKLNQEFAKQYLIKSGRQWLAHFPRAFPIHPMWEAKYFGQEHTVETDERSYTLKVQSITPRVLTIEHFLSLTECDQLSELALSQGLHGSTVYSGSLTKHQRDLSTRSSSNAWLPRDAALLTDQIYRRAARVLQIDEALLQAPIDDDIHAHHHSIAESLQVIRYKAGEEYTAHHDFVYSSQRHRHQPTRFATLLFYLNDDFAGGETVFPRAVNAKYHDGIRIRPQKGKAVLFYSMLPDGNVDDLSQHSSEPVQSGEKFAANLWIWEPVIN